ncbi:MAG TPA: BamA/TamA family outer membrane protein [Burkholderiaceae bacterium]|nr:BamA/TamA family outer membrane protein [Burkholderiaceae bacterium]
MLIRRRPARAHDAIAALLAMLLAASATHAEGWFDKFKDPDDGQFDMGDWLLDQRGFLPVPIVITEPAVGFGAGVMAMFFRESMREAASHKTDDGRLTPPDIYALGGAATENGTWLGMAGGMVYFGDGRYRWRGGISRMSVNLDFFGIGGHNQPLSYNLDGWATVQEGTMRLAQSDVWLGARWVYLDLTNRFDFEGAPGLGSLERASRASGLGLSLEYDSRDNIFTPSRGWTGSLDATFYDPSWGSDTRLQSYRGYAFMYFPIGGEFVIAGRVDGRAADGVVPFFMLPFVDLRGVPAARLQDRRAGVIETEVRWNITPRWAAIGFVGGGRAWGTTTNFSDGSGTSAYGVGFRYLIAKRLGMYAGIDVAKSTLDHAIYLQVGSAWR